LLAPATEQLAGMPFGHHLVDFIFVIILMQSQGAFEEEIALVKMES